MIAATVPYGLAVKLSASLCGVEVSVKSIEQMMDRRAECVAQLDEQQARASNPFDDKGLPVGQQVRPQDAVEPSATPRVAHMELEGVVPMTREELDDEELTEQDKQRRERYARTCSLRAASRARPCSWSSLYSPRLVQFGSTVRERGAHARCWQPDEPTVRARQS